MTSGPVTVLLPEEFVPGSAGDYGGDGGIPADDATADDLLSAWVAAWHPCVLAAAGTPPVGVGLDHLDPAALGGTTIVPACCEHRVTPSSPGPASGRWVSGIRGAAGIAAAAAGWPVSGGGELPGDEYAPDFQALGLAVLLAERLAWRMRSAFDRVEGGFAASVVAAATAAIAGHGVEVRERLQECFGCLESAKARYYPVDVWLIDLVLVHGGVAAAALADELDTPTPIGLVATGEDVATLAAAEPAIIARLRARCGDGSVSPCGGRDRNGALGALTPEQIGRSFARGLESWRTHVGVEPRVHAQFGGGGSALLPRILDRLGYTGAIWSRFDGTPLPDIGTGLVRWRGPGSAAIDTLAGRPVNAGRAATLLELPALIGDAMDHDHVAAVCFAHHAGGCGAWHRLLRRAAGWSSALGTFVAPAEFFRRVAGGGRELRLGADAFPPEPAPVGAEPTAERTAVIDAEARRLAGHGPERGVVFAASAAAGPPLAAAAPFSGRSRRSGWRGVWQRPAPHREHVLDNGLVRLEVHPATGGLLSLRRPGDRCNRLSQRLSLRPAVRGESREHSGGEETPAPAEMVADTLTRTEDASGGRIESRGRVRASDGCVLGAFRQSMTLSTGSALALVDVEVWPAGEGGGVAGVAAVPVCRFAWHENEDVRIRRSVHAQAVPTQRLEFAAEHFVELVGGGWSAVADGTIAILSAAAGRYELTSPHVLDTPLVAAVPCRLAVGLDLERPWDAAVCLRAGGDLAGLPPVGPPHVRVAVEEIGWHEGRVSRARVGLVESTGRAGEVRLQSPRTIVRATAVDARGRPWPAADVAVEGGSLVVFLDAYEWLEIDLEYV